MKNTKKAFVGTAVPSEKRKIGALRQLLPFFKPYVHKLVFILLCMIVSNIAGLYLPNQIGFAIDAIAQGDSGVGGMVACMMLAAVLAFGFTALQNLLSVRVGQSVMADLRKALFQHLERLPVGYFDGMTKGNLMSIMVTDISNVSDTMSSDMITLLTGLVSMTGAFVMMCMISPAMTLVFMLTIPLMGIATWLISKNARKAHHARKTYFGKLCGYTEEMLTAQRSLFVYGQEEVSVQKFSDISCEQRKKGVVSEFYSSLMMPATNTITNMNFTLIAVVGALFALSGRISVGDISSFILYSKKFGGPISDASNIIGMLQSSLAACDRIFAVLNEPLEEEGTDSIHENGILKEETTARTVAKTAGKLQFSHVAFAYDPKTPILRDIDFTIEAGQKVAIVGSTGAGKTTLISLLLRFYDATSGQILLDDVDITDMPLAQLRRYFAMVLQDGWLFDGTVYDNITYAIPPEKRDRESVRAMCRAVGIEEMIEQLPNGYDCILRNDSTALSQGQKQLLSIARAFLCEPSLFILDEATSSIDPQTEHKIQDVTNRVLQGKTSIVIAHRLSTILSADCILVLREGYVVEQGTHTELLAKNGLYRQIFESQFAD